MAELGCATGFGSAGQSTERAAGGSYGQEAAAGGSGAGAEELSDEEEGSEGDSHSSTPAAGKWERAKKGRMVPAWAGEQAR